MPGLCLFYLRQHFQILYNQYPLQASHISPNHPSYTLPFNSTKSLFSLRKLLPRSLLISPLLFQVQASVIFPQGRPCLLDHLPSIRQHFRLRIFHKMFRNVPSPNVSTKVSNVPHTSFFVSLLMLSAGFSPMHSPRYDITVTHKD